MPELLRQLLGLFGQEQRRFREVIPILRAINHSDALTEIVRTTGTPVDDLILQIVRALVPKEV